MPPAAQPMLYYSSILDGSSTDYEGHTTSVIYLGGCPLRCPWCYVPALLSRSTSIPANIEFFVSHYRQQPEADAVCISGGEPTDQGEAFVELCKALKGEGAKIKVETSGFYPDVLIKALPFVDYVAFDVKSVLDIDSYYAVTGSRGNSFAIVTNVIRSIEALKRTAGVFKEFRTTVVPGLTDNAQTIDAITRELKIADLYVLQQFRPDLELVDGLFQGLAMTPKTVLMDLASVAKKNIPNVAIRTVDDGLVRL